MAQDGWMSSHRQNIPRWKINEGHSNGQKHDNAAIGITLIDRKHGVLNMKYLLSLYYHYVIAYAL